MAPSTYPLPSNVTPLFAAEPDPARPNTEDLMAQIETRLRSEMEAELSALRHQTQLLKATMQQRDVALVRVRAELESVAASHLDLQDQLRRRDWTLHALRTALDHMQHSTSWRITAPLRSLRRAKHRA